MRDLDNQGILYMEYRMKCQDSDNPMGPAIKAKSILSTTKTKLNLRI